MVKLYSKTIWTIKPPSTQWTPPKTRMNWKIWCTTPLLLLSTYLGAEKTEEWIWKEKGKLSMRMFLLILLVPNVLLTKLSILVITCFYHRSYSSISVNWCDLVPEGRNPIYGWKGWFSKRNCFQPIHIILGFDTLLPPEGKYNIQCSNVPFDTPKNVAIVMWSTFCSLALLVFNWWGPCPWLLGMLQFQNLPMIQIAESSLWA